MNKNEFIEVANKAFKSLMQCAHFSTRLDDIAYETDLDCDNVKYADRIAQIEDIREIIEHSAQATIDAFQFAIRLLI